MAGRLIVDSNAIDQRLFERIQQTAVEQGKPDRCYAWVLDKLQSERDRGGTMHVAFWRFASRRCRFTIVDAPGHADFAKDIVTAMSQADIAVLVVSADEQQELGADGSAQCREHTLLAYTLGLRQIVVCVSQMDECKFSEESFEEACRVVQRNLHLAGLKTHDVYFDVHFVPTSGLTGDNVLSRSESMPWYCGPTLVEALDDAVASHFKPERPLRVLLQEVMKIVGTGLVAVGRIATGSLRKGSVLEFAPGRLNCQVLAISKHHEELECAGSGDVVNMTVDIDGGLRAGMVGAMIEEDCPARECSSFVAQVIVLAAPKSGEITPDSVLWVQCHMAQVPCAFEDLVSRTDRCTGQVLEMKPSCLRPGDAAVVRLRPHAPLCVEAFADFPPLGRFSVVDQKITVAVGVVQQVVHARRQ